MASAVLFFFNDTATTEIYTLSLHDALPILWTWGRNSEGELGNGSSDSDPHTTPAQVNGLNKVIAIATGRYHALALKRSEEHTSELQSRQYLVCRLLLEKKKHTTRIYQVSIT